jgi:GTP diphosphokinase / guanosine-3',5'-bis(diphosphate) 3'-diphosphatase
VSEPRPARTPKNASNPGVSSHVSLKAVTVQDEALLTLHGYPELAAQLEYLSDADRARVEAAYRFAARAHDGVLRKSGEPYITHPVAVAGILAGLRMDVEAIQAGLLHDTVEDTTVTFEDINREFGTNVRRLVEGETKVSKLSRLAKEHL